VPWTKAGDGHPCFICGKTVKPHPEKPDRFFVSVEFYGHEKKNTSKLGAMLRLAKHFATSHPDHTYHFLHKSPLDSMIGEVYTIALHLQKGLRKAIERSETSPARLHYDLFLWALRYNDPVPLQLALAVRRN
jgi:hypothetical protein